MASSDVARLLDRVLGSIASLTLRTQTTLWSVVDADLWPLRDVLADQQAQLDRRVDLVAGHMRSLGAFPGGAFDGWQELVAIGDAIADERPGGAAARRAVHELVEEHDRTAALVRAACEAVRDAQPDTAELLTAMEHDLSRMRWTLRSMAAALFAAARGSAQLDRVA
jgi:DNA-binding ferritin-like protein